MIQQPISKTVYRCCVFSSILVLIIAYFWLSYNQHVKNPKDTTLPNAGQLYDGIQLIFGKEGRGGWIWEDLSATYTRFFVGLGISSVLSIVLGIAMGCYRPIAAVFDLPLSFFAKIPPTAMMAVYFVIFGTEENFFWACIWLGLLPTLTQTIYQSVLVDVGEHAIHKAYTLGASHFEVIYYVVFLTILPRIIDAIRISSGPAMVFLIAAEYFAADVGIGETIKIQSRLTHMNVVYPYLAMLGAIGYTFDYSLILTRKFFCRWF